MSRSRLPLFVWLTIALQPGAIWAQDRPVVAPAGAGNGTAALIDLDRSAVGPLLQDLLARRAGVSWLERESLDAVLKEQALQQAFAPGGGSDRVALGKLLKADVLVLLRTVESPLPPAPAQPPEASAGAKPPAAAATPKQRQIDVVVCETSLGLRLALGSFPLTSDPKADAVAAEQVVAQGLSKRRERITTICAVPALVSKDLQFQFDYLKTALAKVLEGSLLERPGSLVVELAEAQSVARELGLAGGAAVDRPLPLFLLGEYRNSGRGESRRLSLSLRLMRDAVEIDTRSASDLVPDEVSPFLTRAANELLTKLDGQPALPPKPAVEAQQLAERARAQMRLGSWDEAMPLLEASLLVEPGRTEVMRDAVIVSGHLAKRIVYRTNDVAFVGKALHDYRRGLDHVESFVRSVPDLKPYFLPGLNMSIVDAFPFFHLPRIKPLPELADLYAEVLQAHRDTLMRLARLRAACLSQDPAIVAGDGTVPSLRISRHRSPGGNIPLEALEVAAVGGPTDDYRLLWFALDRLPQQQRYDAIRNMIDELQGLPGFRGRAYRFARGCYPVRVFDTPEGHGFLASLSADARPEVRTAGERISEELKKELATSQQWAADPKYRYTAPGEPQLPPADMQVTFRPIAPKFELAGGKIGALKALDGCQQVDQNTDVMWLNNRLYIMRAKDKVEIGYIFDRRHKRITHASFDGRYLWLVVAGAPTETPVLMVLDHTINHMWQLGGGSLLGKPLEAAKAGASQSLRVVAIEQGKACLAGNFGHSFVALVDFDPQQKIPFRTKLILEALETPDPVKPEQALRADVAFDPGNMCLVEGSPDGEGKETRIVLPRGGANEELYKHPLLIDPQRLKIQVIDSAYPHRRAPQMPPASHDGAVYSIDAMPDHPPRDIRFCRFGFPELRNEALFHNVPQGRILFDNDRVHIVGKKWWVGSLKDGNFAVAGDKLPWYFTNPWSYPGQKSEQNGSEMPVGIFRSSHYGLIISARESDVLGLLTVDFIPRLGATR